MKEIKVGSRFQLKIKSGPNFSWCLKWIKQLGSDIQFAEGWWQGMVANQLGAGKVNIAIRKGWIVSA